MNLDMNAKLARLKSREALHSTTKGEMCECLARIEEHADAGYYDLDMVIESGDTANNLRDKGFVVKYMPTAGGFRFNISWKE